MPEQSYQPNERSSSASSGNHGRIGESFDHIVARYGKPIRGPRDDGILRWYDFEFEDWEITVGFIDERVETLGYHKSPWAFKRWSSTELSEHEINHFLELFGGHWKQIRYHLWLDDSLQMGAGYDDKAQQMIFVGARYCQSLIEKSDKAQQGL